MLILWRAAQESESRALAHAAIVTHAANAAAIINTIAGKETPDFSEMVAALLGEVTKGKAPLSAPAITDNKVLDGLGIVSGDDTLSQMQEF